MSNEFLGEFFGTMFLIILGDGVVANVLLNRSKGENSGWIVITTGWAFAVMVGVFISGAFGSGFGWRMHDGVGFYSSITFELC